ncbi:MAG TPA: hypothetical protein VLA13_02475 [Massilibacterium sp.]|nr:hypothetical protein [Massilibacterium sp.]
MKKFIWLMVGVLTFSFILGCSNETKEREQKEKEFIEKRAKMSPEKVIENFYEAAKKEDFDTFKKYIDVERMTVIRGLYEEDLDKELKKEMKLLANHANSVESYQEFNFTQLDKKDFGTSLLETKPIGLTMKMLEDFPLIAAHYEVDSESPGFIGFIPFINEYGNDVMKEALKKEKFQKDTFLQLALLQMKEDGSIDRALETLYSPEEINEYNEIKSDLLLQIEEEKQRLIEQYQGENSMEHLGKEVSIYLENYIPSFQKKLTQPEEINPQLFFMSKKEDGYFIASFESIILR